MGNWSPWWLRCVCIADLMRDLESEKEHWFTCEWKLLHIKNACIHSLYSYAQTQPTSFISWCERKRGLISNYLQDIDYLSVHLSIDPMNRGKTNKQKTHFRLKTAKAWKKFGPRKESGKRNRERERPSIKPNSQCNDGCWDGGAKQIQLNSRDYGWLT